MVGERWKIGYIIEEKAGKYPKDSDRSEGERIIIVKGGTYCGQKSEKNTCRFSYK